ncbi:hypothetical protein ERJ75_001149300 [Trypanosoma vivax]|uniref:Uncharacterized protein n=1 Tax=Trypanosoma vivax (strain Y486) TaxID=1055687 RepID=F9WPX9_TRYVY|nr:hypothetical protein ERJ75_001844400 [Trypanosoma vivax]KAH8609963.1 hypothetical protein ERJ75_001149300 [Trypanosoma vivax]CCD19606.1 hypothetical protein, conserved [Trypanosoma vivax Y486]|eukprot:CCD19606.1 hypothetical protein, conserved [Trypanosoma vivax Y486]
MVCQNLKNVPGTLLCNRALYINIVGSQCTGCPPGSVVRNTDSGPVLIDHVMRVARHCANKVVAEPIAAAITGAGSSSSEQEFEQIQKGYECCMGELAVRTKELRLREKEIQRLQKELHDLRPMKETQSTRGAQGQVSDELRDKEGENKCGRADERADTSSLSNVLGSDATCHGGGKCPAISPFCVEAEAPPLALHTLNIEMEGTSSTSGSSEHRNQPTSVLEQDKQINGTTCVQEEPFAAEKRSIKLTQCDDACPSDWNAVCQSILLYESGIVAALTSCVDDVSVEGTRRGDRVDETPKEHRNLDGGLSACSSDERCVVGTDIVFPEHIITESVGALLFCRRCRHFLPPHARSMMNHLRTEWHRSVEAGAAVAGPIFTQFSGALQAMPQFREPVTVVQHGQLEKELSVSDRFFKCGFDIA